MAEDEGVQVDDPTAETHQETTDPVVDDVKQPATEEPVDETGVPIKNRQAEAERKARKMTSSQAQSELLKPATTDPGSNQDEAIQIVKNLAKEEAKRLYEPLLAKQFLMEHPEARDMIDEINAVRTSHPELAGVENLELALKVAKADMQDEIIRKQVEAKRKQEEETISKSNEASSEGVKAAKGKTSGTDDLATQISNASLEELQKLEASIK